MPEATRKLEVAKEIVNRTQKAMDGRMQQSVVLTFNDGSFATFTGPAVVFPGEVLSLVDIVFTEPTLLDDDCYWGQIRGGDDE